MILPINIYFCLPTKQVNTKTKTSIYKTFVRASEHSSFLIFLIVYTFPLSNL